MNKFINKKSHKIIISITTFLFFIFLILNSISCCSNSHSPNYKKNIINFLSKNKNLIYEHDKPAQSSGANQLNLSYRDKLYQSKDKAITNTLHIDYHSNNYLAIISGVAFAISYVDNDKVNKFNQKPIVNYLQLAITYYQNILKDGIKNTDNRLSFVIKATQEQQSIADGINSHLFNISCLVTLNNYQIYHFYKR